MIRFVVPHPRGWDIQEDSDMHRQMLAIAKADGQLVPWVGTFTLSLASCVISLGAGPTWTISLSWAGARPTDAACETLRICCRISEWREIEGSKHARYFQIPAEKMDDA